MREQVLHECDAMARYALASGMAIPPQLMAAIDQARATPAGQPADMAALTRAHTQLAKLVAPATPRALLLMGDEHDGPRLSWLGHVGIVRRMMLASVIAMLAFLAVSVTKVVDDPHRTLQNTWGWEAVALEVWWLSAAAMGASFAMLMQVSDFIVKRTYDPKYEPTYWIKLLLGIMAGLILVGLVPIPETTGAGSELAKPAVALLGGFSASAVYRILTRLVETVESFFRASAREEAAQRERAAQLRANEDTSQTRLALAGQLVKLQQQMDSGAAAADVSGSLQQILHGLVPGDPTQAAGAQPAGTISLPGVPIVGAPAGGEEGDGDASTPTAEAPQAPAPAAAAPSDPAVG
ncbi:MAG TPA: hypothetical protein VF541_21780 [Longimicrobium sp.]|jgi:hypothetical protein